MPFPVFKPQVTEPPISITIAAQKSVLPNRTSITSTEKGPTDLSSKADSALDDTVSANENLPADPSSMPLQIHRENLPNKIDTGPERQSDKIASNSDRRIQVTEEQGQVSNDQADQSNTESSLVKKLAQMAKPALKTQQGETVYPVQD